jgi:hypothetical protein
MTVATDYLHALDGRIRIKIPELKGSPEKSQEIKQHLSTCAGINYVQANPTTGNALILYNSMEISQNEIIALLKEGLGCFRAPAAMNGNRQGEGLAGTVARAFMESALQTMVMALI